MPRLTKLDFKVWRYTIRLTQSNGAIVFMWEQFSAYHVDRLDAAALAFGCFRVIGIEVASKSRTYAWTPVTAGHTFLRITLFDGAVCDDISWHRKLVKSMIAILKARPSAVFLCNIDKVEIIGAALLLRLLRIPIYAMLDAKFDDSPRRVVKEALKRPVLSLFTGALVAGERSVAYYRFLGMREGWARTAYDTVSVERVQLQAGKPPAPEGLEHAKRDFIIVARFVIKKNLALAIRAYARYRAMATRNASFHRLVLCGSGDLEDGLRALIAELEIGDCVELAGFVSHEEVARRLANGLALILPSVEEQWGLVINEAVALGVPILCSDNVGARDTLVRVGVNGFIFEPDNEHGLANLMQLLAEDEALWMRLAEGSRRLAPLGDTSQFVSGVSELLHIEPIAQSSRSPHLSS